MLTPEVIADWRHIAAGPTHGVNINSRLLIALLDAADERDELAGVESRLSALLWDLTGGKLSKTSYPVAFMAQEIEEYLAQYQESEAADERDRLAAAIERAKQLHTPDGEGLCHACDYGTQYPCPTIQALDGSDG